jgi:hypothetical protein
LARLIDLCLLSGLVLLLLKFLELIGGCAASSRVRYTIKTNKKAREQEGVESLHTSLYSQVLRNRWRNQEPLPHRRSVEKSTRFSEFHGLGYPRSSCSGLSTHGTFLMPALPSRDKRAVIERRSMRRSCPTRFCACLLLQGVTEGNAPRPWDTLCPRAESRWRKPSVHYRRNRSRI